MSVAYPGGPTHAAVRPRPAIARPLLGAVDVGATKTLVTVRETPLGEWSTRGAVVRLPTPRTPVELVAAIAGAFEQLLAGSRPGAGTGARATDAGRLAVLGRLATVGVGTPGPLDAAAGIVIHAPNQRWRDVPLARMLADALGVPVAIDDDANLGALGEAILGAGRGADPVAYVTVSTGIGAGIVVDGRIVHGAHGAGGEIGHLVLDPAGPRCGCGRRGCVEAYAAGAGLERRARAELGHRGPGGTGSGARSAVRGAAGRAGAAGRSWSAADVFAAAAAGDPGAARLISEGESALARAFAALLATVDPEVIVVGGSLALAHRRYVSRAARAARRLAIVAAGRGAIVRASALGAESVLAGAAVLAGRVADEPGSAE